MKTFKYILILFLAFTFSNCGSNDSEPPYLLTNANIAGNYNIGSLIIDAKAIATTSGIAVTISNAKSIGDTFQVDFILTANGTYTANGQYRVASTITPITGDPITDSSILLVDDSGTYQINSTNDAITFTSSLGGDFIEGELKVTTFNETIVSFNQEFVETEGSITTELNTSISFVRK